MEFPIRKNIRLKHWDYSTAGCYHTTFCTADKAKVLGQVVCPEGERAYVNLTELSLACEDAIEAVPDRLPGAAVPNHVVMPNHVHMLVSLQGERAPQLGRIVSFVKSEVTKAARRADPGVVVWQRQYNDRIVRDEADFDRVWTYIDDNPAKWGSDEYCM